MVDQKQKYCLLKKWSVPQNNGIDFSNKRSLRQWKISSNTLYLYKPSALNIFTMVETMDSKYSCKQSMF